MALGAFKIKIGPNLWAVIGGGSGNGDGGIVGGDPVDTPPAQPSIYDDEFLAGEELDPKWTKSIFNSDNPANVLWVQENGTGKFQHVNNGTFACCLSQPCPAGEWTATIKMRMSFFNTLYQTGGLFSSNNVEDQGRTLLISTNGDANTFAYIFRMSKTTLGWQGDFVGGQNYTRTAFVYIRLQRYLNGGVSRVRASMSNDGLEYSTMWDGLETDYMPGGVIHNFAVYQGSNANLRGSFAFEYFRVTTP